MQQDKPVGRFGKATHHFIDLIERTHSAGGDDRQATVSRALKKPRIAHFTGWNFQGIAT